MNFWVAIAVFLALLFGMPIMSAVYSGVVFGIAAIPGGMIANLLLRKERYAGTMPIPAILVTIFFQSLVAIPYVIFVVYLARNLSDYVTWPFVVVIWFFSFFSAIAPVWKAGRYATKLETGEMKPDFQQDRYSEILQAVSISSIYFTLVIVILIYLALSAYALIGLYSESSQR